jgi:hypothetical protein
LGAAPKLVGVKEVEVFTVFLTCNNKAGLFDSTATGTVHNVRGDFARLGVQRAKVEEAGH